MRPHNMLISPEITSLRQNSISGVALGLLAFTENFVENIK